MIANDVDVIVPIATPAVQSMLAAVEDTDIPIIFSAVSDPIKDGIVADLNAPGGKATGTSDALNTEMVMELMLAANPDIQKVGLLYSKSESSSAKPVEEAKAYLAAKGIAVEEKTGTNTNEISSAVDALVAAKVDAIFTPTDNTVQSAELAIFEKLQDAKIPHYGGADSFALNGAFCGYGVDYVQLGQETARMVADLLANGADPASTPVRIMTAENAVINTETCAAIGMDLEQIKAAFSKLGQETARMVADLLANGADPASTPVRIMTAENAVINTETCAAIGMDLEQIKAAFSKLGINVIETTTQQSFS